LLNKPLFIKTFDWVKTTATNGNITGAALQVPSDLLINDVIRAPFNTSLFYTCKMCFHIQVIGTPFHQGALLVYYKPNNGFATAFPADSINDAQIAPSVILYANQSTPACLEIPFSCPTNVANTDFDTVGKPYYNNRFTKFGSNIGAIYAKVIVPVDSQSTTTVRVSYYVTFQDIKFFVPKNGTMIAPLSNTQKLDNNTKEPEKSKEYLVFEMETIAAMAMPSIGKFIKDGIDKVQNKVFKMVGLDKPTQPLVTETERMTTTTNYNHTEGVVPLDRMTMFTSHITTADKTTFPSEFDEMSMSYILRKEQYVSNVYTRSDDAVGKCIFSIPMSPLCVPIITGTNTGVPIQTRMYMLSKYWRGQLRYHFKFSMSDMQMAKLIFVKAYGIGNFSKFPLLTDLSNYDTETYEINKGGQEVIIKCDYNAMTEMLFNTFDYASGTLQHGQLFVYVLQPVQYPASALNYITATVSISCGEDFSFYGPAEYQYIRPNNLANFAARAIQGKETLEFQSESLDKKAPTGDKKVEPNKNVDIGCLQDIVPSTVPSCSTNTTDLPFSPRPHIHNMAPITHIRDMLRRYVQCSAFKAQDVQVFKIADLFREIKYCSVFTHLSDFYYAFKGGLRFRLMLPSLIQGQKVKAYYRYPLPNTSTTTGVNYLPSQTLPGRTLTAASFNYVYDVADTNGPVFVPLLLTVNQVDCHLDFEITIENPFKYNVVHQAANLAFEDDIATDLGTLLIAFPPDYVTKECGLFVSLADEARFGMLCYNPPIYVHIPSINSDFASSLPATAAQFYFAAS